jgi:hypothetical protein
VNFAEALAVLHIGKRVTRRGWNGRNMWLLIVPGSTITVAAGRPLGDAAPELIDRQVAYRPHIDMFTANGEVVPWVATQSDLLGDDWEIVDGDRDWSIPQIDAVHAFLANPERHWNWGRDVR